MNIETAQKWTDIDNKYYEQITALKEYGIKVLIALNALNDAGGDKYDRLLKDKKTREDFIRSIVVFITKHNFDGLDLDLEVSRLFF